MYLLFKTESAVESLSREILTIQAKGDKAAAASLLQKYGVISEPLKLALQKLEKVQVLLYAELFIHGWCKSIRN